MPRLVARIDALPGLLSPLKQLDLRGEGLHQGGKLTDGASLFLDASALRGDLAILLLRELVQPLYRRERYTIGVHRGDRRIVFAHAEGSLEVLRHRADVPDRLTLRLAAPE